MTIRLYRRVTPDEALELLSAGWQPVPEATSFSDGHGWEIAMWRDADPAELDEPFEEDA